MWPCHRLILLFAAGLLGGCAGTGGVDSQPEDRQGLELGSQVAGQIGFYGDSYLRNYVDAVGRRLVAELGPTPYRFNFQILDAATPLSFSIPQGFVYLSRGLIALVDSEDELAGILAHEISHVTARHHELGRRRTEQPPLAPRLPGEVMATLVAEQIGAMVGVPLERAGRVEPPLFSPAQEREADEAAVRLVVRAGYDPGALASILATMERSLPELEDRAQEPGYFAVHPGPAARIAAIRVASGTLAREPARAFAKNRAGFLSRLDGLYWGPGNPLQGVFHGNRFLQPDMGFAISFPDAWRTVNTPNFVGAFAPGDQALVVMGGAGPMAPPAAFAAAQAAELAKRLGRQPDEDRPVELGDWPAHLLRIGDRSGGQPVAIFYLWVRSDRNMFRIVAAGPEQHAETLRQAVLSLRSLTPEDRASIRARRLRIAEARSGETLRQLSARSGNEWSLALTAAVNGLPADGPLPGGELVKIMRTEPYL